MVFFCLSFFFKLDVVGDGGVAGLVAGWRRDPVCGAAVGRAAVAVGGGGDDATAAVGDGGGVHDGRWGRHPLCCFFD